MLSDINSELITTYREIRDNVEAVISRLSKLEISSELFSEMRSRKPRLSLTLTVRLLYLNRTAFNGIYRVNRQGIFNTPFGCRPNTVLCEAELLRQASRSLQNRGLAVLDFEEAIDQAEAGDLVYADPPYTTKHNNNGFRRYNEVLFSWEDQDALRNAARAARRRAHVIVSNAHHEPVMALYGGFNVQRIARQSLISGSTKGRCEVGECLIYCVRGASR